MEDPDSRLEKDSTDRVFGMEVGGWLMGVDIIGESYVRSIE